MFAAIIESQVCEYLLYIKELNQFVDKISKDGCTNANIPFTYYNYAHCLRKILGDYKIKLMELERKVLREDGVVTMRSLFSELRPYLQNLRYICIVHRRAVYANFKTEDNWKCALRLLSVLYNEIMSFNNCEKRTTFGLFLYSFRTYLRIFDKMSEDIPLADHRNEFIIY
uniref:Gamma-tubulin complex component n=2 Tax=Rhodnius prolixus TaxID=13249 RepID=T1I5T4_RHOPR